MPEIDLDTIRNRVVAELPRQARWMLNGTPLDFDFSRSSLPLQPISEGEVYGPIEEEWKNLYLFGDLDYAEGGGSAPFLTINASDGEIGGLDVEDEYVFYLNADIESFIKTFTLLNNAIRSGTWSPDIIRIAANEIPRFEQSEWKLLLDQNKIT